MSDTNPPAADRATTRNRNQHCMNCGDNRGGPIGHETSECTYDSVTTQFRAALKPSYRITLAYLIADAQQDTHPMADAAGGTGPYIVHGCVVNSAQQLKDAVRAVWKHGPELLDRLDRYKQENNDLRDKFAAAQEDLDEIRGRYGDLVSDNNDLTTEKEQLAARVGELEVQLAAARAMHRLDEEMACGNWEHTNRSVECPECTDVCAWDGEPWPCGTAKALGEVE